MDSLMLLAQAETAAPDTPMPVVAALIGALALGIITFLVAGRLEPRFVGAFALLAALSAGFGLFVAAIPSSNEWVALAVFAGFFGFLRLLSRFESIRS